MCLEASLALGCLDDNLLIGNRVAAAVTVEMTSVRFLQIENIKVKFINAVLSCLHAHHKHSQRVNWTVYADCSSSQRVALCTLLLGKMHKDALPRDGLPAPVCMFAADNMLRPTWLQYRIVF